MQLTAKQVLKKYKGKYIEVYACPMWDVNEKGERLFEVRKSYRVIHENTTLVEDENFINNY
jgi:lipocalin